jgi:methionine-rich copper-binding protein CopC
MNAKPARLILLVIGSVLLLFAAWNWLVPRPRYLSSTPSPNSVLTTMPTTVSLEFSDPLDRESTLAVASTITLSAEGQEVYGDGKRFTAAGPSAGHGRILSVALDPNLPKGFYWVSWSAVAARGKAKSFGDFCFSVGMPIPESIARDRRSAVVEHDYRYRDQRAMVVGGFLLIALGLLLPHFRDSDGRHSSDWYSGK